MESFQDEHIKNRHLFLDKQWPLRTVVGVMCALSVVGSLIIILSYCFKDLRTKARWILLHLSIMDLGAALSNFTGDVANFDRFYYNGSQSPSYDWHPAHVSTPIHILCVVQAFFAEYFTLGAVLWTGCLAVHMYLLILYQGLINPRIYLYAFYLFAYGMPLLVSLWLVFTHRLGYAPYDSSGWCSIICTKPTGEVDIFVSVFGYDLWIYGTVFLILVVYLSVHFYLRREFRRRRGSAPAMHNVEYKFIVIPLVFILLRIWTQVMGLHNYVGTEAYSLPSGVTAVLLYLSGVGDSGQGFANAILFVAFTKSVRRRFKALLRRCLCCVKPGNLLDDVRADEGYYYNITESLSSDSELTSSCQTHSSAKPIHDRDSLSCSQTHGHSMQQSRYGSCSASHPTALSEEA